MNPQEYCRTCLETGSIIRNVDNTFIAALYEMFTSVPFNKIETIISICNKCYIAFKRCESLRLQCIKVESTLQQAFKGGFSSNTNLPYLSTLNTLSISNPITTDYMPSEHNILPTNNILDIKEENDMKYDELINDRKENDEYYDNKINMIKLCNIEVEMKNIDNDDKFHSDDDIPLITLKNGNKTVQKERKCKRKQKIIKEPEQLHKEVVLTKEEQLDSFNKRSLSGNYLMSAYRCGCCFKGFNNKTTFDNHMVKHDTTSGEFECDICRVRYRNIRLLKSHQNQAHIKYYQCQQCDHVSQTASQARFHDNFHKGLVYNCEVCGDKFRTPSALLTHVRLSHPSSHTCVKCGDSYISLHGLRMHQHKVHRHQTIQESELEPSVDTELYCKSCDLQFVNAHAHQRHYITSVNHTHEILDRDDCIICGVKFISNIELRKHMISHRKRGKIKDIETNKKDRQYIKLKCEHCDQHYSSKPLLQNHIKRKHLGIVYIKHVVCEHCGKRFKSQATLKYHQRTHTGEKPYPCDVCPKRFSNSNALKIHKRSHNGDKPYQCGICQMRFRQKPTLNRHMTVHTGAKPYQCKYCLKSFSQTNSLKLHIDAVHYKIKRNNKKKVEVNDSIGYE